MARPTAAAAAPDARGDPSGGNVLGGGIVGAVGVDRRERHGEAAQGEDRVGHLAVQVGRVVRVHGGVGAPEIVLAEPERLVARG